MTATRPPGQRSSIRLIIAGVILLAISVGVGLMLQTGRPIRLLDHMPLRNKDIVLLGDSHFEYFDAPEILNDKRIRNKGISGQTAHQMLQRVDEIVKAGPRKVLLLAGANDINQGRSREDYLRDMRSLVDLLRSGAGDVAVVSIPPSSDSRAQEQRSLFNEGLQALCTEKKVVYIDIVPQLEKKGRLDPDLTTDGVHLNDEGYRRIAPEFKRFIKE